MRQMIVLCGSSGTGKTTTLIKLANALAACKGANVLYPLCKSQILPRSQYYEVTLNGGQVNGITLNFKGNILIAIDGDTPQIMAQNFARVTAQTDVFVLASRSKHGSKILGMIEAFAQQYGLIPDYIAAVYNSPALHPQVCDARVKMIAKLIS